MASCVDREQGLIRDLLMPNVIAFVVYWLWVPSCVVLLNYVRPLPRAASYAVLIAVLFLPSLVAIDLPALPPLDRERLTTLVLLIVLLVLHNKLLIAARPGRKLEWVSLVMLLGAFATVLTNRRPLIYGDTTLPGLGLQNALAITLAILFDFFLPFLLARSLFRRPSDLRYLFEAICVLGVVYFFLVLFELRFSPMLSLYLYGFHPHDDFMAHVRYGGFRPMVFIGSGLAVSLYLSCVAMSSATLGVLRVPVLRVPSALLAPLFIALLVGAKSLASTIYALLCVPLIFLARARSQMRVALIMMLLAVSFPTCRIAQLVPTDALVGAAALINPDRARSLNYRFDQEVGLIEKARQKMLFGWGGNGRPLVYEQWTKSTVDGFWIIQFGIYGLVGLGTYYVLLAYPVFLAWRRLKRVDSQREALLLSGLSLIIAVNAVDQIPNGLFVGLPIFYSGALYGAALGVGSARMRRKPIRRGESDSVVAEPGGAEAGREPEAPRSRPAALANLIRSSNRKP